MTHIVFCKKLNKEAEGLDNPPYPGQLGMRIFEQVSKEAWEMWMDHQTMLINEYRLSMADPKAREFIQQEMEKFLFGSGSEKPPGYSEEE